MKELMIISKINLFYLRIPFIQINCDNESEILNTLQRIKESTSSIFLSNTLNLPLNKSNNQYNAIQNFVFKRSILDTNLYLYMFIRDLKILSNHSMPNVLIGRINLVQDLLKASLNSNKNDIVPFKYFWDQNSLSYDSFVNSRCLIEFSVRNVLEKSHEDSRLISPINSKYGNSFYKLNKHKEEYLQSKTMGKN